MAAFLAGAVLATAVVAHAVPSRSRTASRDRYRTLDAFAESLSYILNQYVHPLDERKLVYAAIQGMVDQLDQHSSFLPPRRYQRLRQDTEGEFAGVGLTLGANQRDGGPPVVEAVVSGSPAARARVAVGDEVLTIDKRTTTPAGKDVGPKSWHSRLRGRAGTRVAIRVHHRGAAARDLTLVRELVKVPSVDWFFLEPGIGYVSVSKFQEATSADARAALTAMVARSPAKRLRGLVLDLRGNPGGLLDQGIHTADLFLDHGTIATVGGRPGTPVERELAHSAGTFGGFPMVALVDQGTASAAEIVAGALEDQKRASIVGLPSFGKGSVQTFLDLRDGSGLKLTTAHYFTPSGRSLEGVGIKPDFEVEAFEAEDVMASGGDESEAGGDEPRPPPQRSGPGSWTKAMIRQRIEEDPQLRAAYQMVKARAGSKH